MAAVLKPEFEIFFYFELICIKSLINHAETVTDAVFVLFVIYSFLLEHIEWEIIRKIFSLVFFLRKGCLLKRNFIEHWVTYVVWYDYLFLLFIYSVFKDSVNTCYDFDKIILLIKVISLFFYYYRTLFWNYDKICIIYFCVIGIFDTDYIFQLVHNYFK